MRRVTLTQLAAVATAALLATSCSDPSEPAAAPSTSASGTPAATSTTRAAATDPSGVKACTEVKAANAGKVFEPDPAVMRAIATAGQQSTNDSIRTRAALLGQAAELAEAAKGASDEASMKIGLGTAALNLETACTEQRYFG